MFVPDTEYLNKYCLEDNGSTDFIKSKMYSRMVKLQEKFKKKYMYTKILV